MNKLAEIRFYSSGWIVRFGPFSLRYANQLVKTKSGPSGYTSLTLERLRQGTSDVGGMTWSEWRRARKQSAAAKVQRVSS